MPLELSVTDRDKNLLLKLVVQKCTSRTQWLLYFGVATLIRPVFEVSVSVCNRPCCLMLSVQARLSVFFHSKNVPRVAGYLGDLVYIPLHLKQHE